MMSALVLVDGLSVPQIGLGTGWLVAIVFVWSLVSGRLWTRSAHREAMAGKDTEIDRVDHDRQEWRTESRIKDAQIVEMAEQLREKDRQLSLLEPLARTVDKIMSALQQGTGGSPS